ncbi:HRDC domain-containing protein, partial [Streptomyces sp. YIM 98790]|uniref:HRDC domain-containing protein n=1 Tax=Streptomyces sp. YIM 98790 TaxID=2689077 RepID=UPI001A9DA29F
GSGGVERGGGGAGGRRRQREPARCRVCGATLTEAAELKLRRCADCPSAMDEELYERLRAWRLERARELGRPAYAVFTDVTLIAIAEDVPSSTGELSRIPGVGPHKLRQFGEEVLALCAGRELPVSGGADAGDGDGDGEDGGAGPSAPGAAGPGPDPLDGFWDDPEGVPPEDAG